MSDTALCQCGHKRREHADAGATGRCALGWCECLGFAEAAPLGTLERVLVSSIALLEHRPAQVWPGALDLVPVWRADLEALRGAVNALRGRGLAALGAHADPLLRSAPLTQAEKDYGLQIQPSGAGLGVLHPAPRPSPADLMRVAAQSLVEQTLAHPDVSRVYAKLLELHAPDEALRWLLADQPRLAGSTPIHLILGGCTDEVLELIAWLRSGAVAEV